MIFHFPWGLAFQRQPLSESLARGIFLPCLQRKSPKLLNQRLDSIGEIRTLVNSNTQIVCLSTSLWVHDVFWYPNCVLITHVSSYLHTKFCDQTWVIKCPHFSHHPTIRYMVYNGYFFRWCPIYPSHGTFTNPWILWPNTACFGKPHLRWPRDVDGGHQALNDAEVFMHHLKAKRRTFTPSHWLVLYC